MFISKRKISRVLLDLEISANHVQSSNPERPELQLCAEGTIRAIKLIRRALRISDK